MAKETNMLEELMAVAKKYGWRISDFSLDAPRIEIGMEKEEVKV